jgi:hypothetical protein
MLRAVICIAIAIVAATIPGASTEARGKQRGKLAEAPIKDCTRLNGRWGYYGNPWCTPVEQLRWDRWDAQRR